MTGIISRSTKTSVFWTLIAALALALAATAASAKEDVSTASLGTAPKPVQESSNASVSVLQKPAASAVRLLAASGSQAQAGVTGLATERPVPDSASDLEIVEIDRDAEELRDVLRPRDMDQDYADTALVFANSGARPVKVQCKAWNRGGEGIGRLMTSVPGRGVGFLLASDFGGGLDFVGRAHCRSSRHVIATGFFLGPEITDLAVVSKPSVRQGATDHQFPLVATY